ncbi:hypothetical protein ACH4TV_27110 [Streptomyces sp. NPDC020898]|uniref:hypothetical protein n=1 Tax=Streptomyces sp. NPDC020898 TaxID=3365101 RepID=UPI0037AA50FE
MATELEELRNAILSAIHGSPTAAERVAELLERSDIPGLVDAWILDRPGQAAADERLFLLGILSRDHPQIIAGLREISRDHTPVPTTASRVAGDHLDFRDATFHERFVGVQHNHYGSAPATAPAWWRPVGEVGPVEFGVRPTRHVPGLPDVPPYVTRDCDQDLHTKLAHSGLVLILGEPYAGTSFTAWQAVRSLEGYRLYAPDPGEDLRGLPDRLKAAPGDYVIWLDELTEHLGEGALEPRLLGRLTSHGAVVFGTMRPAEYYRRRAGSTPGDRVVAMARTVDLPREWSEAELARLGAHDDDPRAYPAYMWSGKEGVTSYFAIGHLLFDEWTRAGTQLEHPRGQLLVRAAVDLARCGVTKAVPTALLKAAEFPYLRGEQERESFEDSLAWATTPLFGVSGLLVSGEKNDTWRAYGALVAEVLRSENLPPVPDQVWWTLLERLNDWGIDRAAVLDAARAAFRSRVEAGDVGIMRRFAWETDGEEKEAWLRRAADLDDDEAAVQLGELLLRRGDGPGAIPYLERAASRGRAAAAGLLGLHYRNQAQRWLTEATVAGDQRAKRALSEWGSLLPPRISSPAPDTVTE